VREVPKERVKGSPRKTPARNPGWCVQGVLAEKFLGGGREGRWEGGGLPKSTHAGKKNFVKRKSGGNWRLWTQKEGKQSYQRPPLQGL